MCSLDGDNYMYLAGGSSPLLLVNKNISNAGLYDNVVCYNCDSRKVYLGKMMHVWTETKETAGMTTLATRTSVFLIG